MYVASKLEYRGGLYYLYKCVEVGRILYINPSCGDSGVPTSIYEAASLDNAGKLCIFFKITLPMISPQIFFTLIVLTIGSFKIFDMIFIMTGGGPNNASTSLVFYIYSKVFQEFDIGKGSCGGRGADGAGRDYDGILFCRAF